MLLYNLLVVYDKLKFKSKLVRRLLAKEHTVEENFKVIYDRAYSRIDRKAQNDLTFFGIYIE